MPLHRFYVPRNLYTAEDKEAIAAAVTRIYTSFGLPAFYVVVLFISVDIDDYFVGAKKTDKFLRISIQHIARQFPDDAVKRAFMDKYEATIEPWTKARGIDWEIQAEDADRVLWNVNGMVPPQSNTVEEKVWVQQNRAVPYDEIKNYEGKL